MVWRPFATKPERADTSEAAGLPAGAPLLYSTRNCLSKPDGLLGVIIEFPEWELCP